MEIARLFFKALTETSSLSVLDGSFLASAASSASILSMSLAINRHFFADPLKGARVMTSG